MIKDLREQLARRRTGEGDRCYKCQYHRTSEQRSGGTLHAVYVAYTRAVCGVAGIISLLIKETAVAHIRMHRRSEELTVCLDTHCCVRQVRKDADESRMRRSIFFSTRARAVCALQRGHQPAAVQTRSPAHHALRLRVCTHVGYTLLVPIARAQSSACTAIQRGAWPPVSI